MAQIEIMGLHTGLEIFPVAFASGDTVLNTSKGVLTLCIGEISTTAVSGAKTVIEKEGSEINLKTGETSDAITIVTGEALFLRNTRPGMSGSIDSTIASTGVAALAVTAKKK